MHTANGRVLWYPEGGVYHCEDAGETMYLERTPEIADGPRLAVFFAEGEPTDAAYLVGQGEGWPLPSRAEDGETRVLISRSNAVLLLAYLRWRDIWPVRITDPAGEAVDLDAIEREIRHRLTEVKGWLRTPPPTAAWVRLTFASRLSAELDEALRLAGAGRPDHTVARDGSVSFSVDLRLVAIDHLMAELARRDLPVPVAMAISGGPRFPFSVQAIRRAAD